MYMDGGMNFLLHLVDLSLVMPLICMIAVQVFYYLIFSLGIHVYTQLFQLNISIELQLLLRFRRKKNSQKCSDFPSSP